MDHLDLSRDVVSLTADLVDIASESLAEQEICDAVEAALAALPHLDVVRDGHTLVARTSLGRPERVVVAGHLDTVPANANFPSRLDGEVLWGLGSCDMKGGVAALVFAAEAIARNELRLAGDLLVATNTDEESSGAGAMALVARGVRADAGIVPEPTGFDVWTACRGSTLLTIDVPGRPGHAEMPQPSWREGGAVNSIEKATVVLDEIRRMRRDWLARDDLAHPQLSAGDIVPTVVSGGEWDVTYPASCTLSCVVTYTPARAVPGRRWSSDLEREVAERISRAAAADDWLAEHPPTLAWTAGVMPMELAVDEPIVATVLGAGADVGRPGQPSGLDSWFDGATFTTFASTPTVAFGPSGRDGTKTVPHTVDEFVAVDDLVACAQALAVAAVRFCGMGS